MEKEQLDKLWDALSSREKAAFISDSHQKIASLAAKGIHPIKATDSPKFLDFLREDSEKWESTRDHCVSYPSASAIAASWNRENARIMGEQMGLDAKQRGYQMLFRPAINIKRNPLCGRNFEYYSEDPVLTAELAGAFIDGTQGVGTGACVKHFAVNSQEFERMTTNAVVSQRALREIYLRAFQLVIENHHPWGLMTSYNRVNGQYVTENKQLMEILRKEWNYDGYVTSDAGSVKQGLAAVSHENGMDFEMGSSHMSQVQNALDQGRLKDGDARENFRRIVDAAEKSNEIPLRRAIDRDQEHMLVRRMAADAMVLLKNDGILPLCPEQDIAVIGSFAKECNHMGGGSAFSNPYRKETPYEEIQKLIGKSLPYGEGYVISEDPYREAEPDPRRIAEAETLAKEHEIVLFFTSLPYLYECEGWDRLTLELPRGQVEALKVVLKQNKHVVIINVSGGCVALSEFLVAAGILQVYFGGESYGGAIADVLFGRQEPGGRLPETFPVRMEDTPAFLYTPNYPVRSPNVLYGEDIFVGYRWYEKRKIKPLFPFGHGLSYTTFSYGPLALSTKELSDNDELTVEISVKNTGERIGSQVLQLYVVPHTCHAIRPMKELKSFEKVNLKPGEERRVAFRLGRKAFEYFSEAQDRWIVESGAYEIQIGISSEVIVGRDTIHMQSAQRAVQFHDWLPVEWAVRDPHIQEAMRHLSPLQRQNIVPTGSSLLAATPIVSGQPIHERLSGREKGSSITQEELDLLLDNLNQYREE